MRKIYTNRLNFNIMDLYTVIIFGLVVGIVIFLAVKLSNWLQSKAQSAHAPSQPLEEVSAELPSSPSTARTGAEIMQDFLTQNACQINTCETSDNWTYHVFVYQGAYFESYSQNTTDEVLVYYHWSVPYSRENYAWVQRICNHLSNESKYIKVTHR